MSKKKGVAEAAATDEVSSEVARKVSEVRSQVRESFGKITMAMMAIPRYRHQSIADLQHMVLEPLIRDRVAIAYPASKAENALSDIAGVAIWASVSDEVDVKIREQIAAGVFPIRLKSEDWTSGETNWLLDVIAPDRMAVLSVVSNFKKVVKDGDLRLHPLVAHLLGNENLGDLGLSEDNQPTEEVS